MKTILLLGVWIAYAIGASDSNSVDLAFTVSVRGAEGRNILLEGLRPSELTQLTVAADDEQVVITEFEIVLVRGKSPVKRYVKKGNTCDLEYFRHVARAADRIIVTVKSISGAGSNQLTGENSSIIIPIKA